MEYWSEWRSFEVFKRKFLAFLPNTGPDSMEPFRDQMPTEDRFLMTKSELLNKIAVALGGGRWPKRAILRIFQNVGLIERPERIILLGIGALFDLFTYVLPLLAVLGNITVFQRIHYVWQKTEETKREIS